MTSKKQSTSPADDVHESCNGVNDKQHNSVGEYFLNNGVFSEQQQKDYDEFVDKIISQQLAFGTCYVEIPESLRELLKGMEGTFPSTKDSAEIAEMYDKGSKATFIIKPMESSDFDNNNNPESSDI